MNRAEEDYVKNIYKLTVEQNKELVKNNELATTLDYTDQTVNEMIKKLVSKGFVIFYPYKGIKLTKSGINEAQRLLRSHRLWEVFLVQKLNYTWEMVHEEAEMLEHASSEQLVDHLDNYLEKPTYGVHGNIIPRQDKNNEEVFHKSLSKAKIGETIVVKRVNDQTKLLHFLDKNSIVLGTKLLVLENDQYLKIMTVKKDDSTIVMSYVVADYIFGKTV